MAKNKFLYKLNLKDEISPIRDEIIFDAVKTKHLADYNFEVFSKHNEYIYNIILSKCRDLFNFSLVDEDFRVWCLYNDKHYLGGNNRWHNHIKSSTINCVLYLKTIEGCGFKYHEHIDLNHNVILPEKCELYEKGNNIKYVEPKDFDVFIFPDFLMHTPTFPQDKLGDNIRVSLNLEFRCSQKSIEIFNIKG